MNPIAFLPLLFLGTSPAVPTGTAKSTNPPAVTVAPVPVDPEAVKRWRDDRFGMFIHWGPVSLTEKEISWSRGATNGTPVEEYDSLYKSFNPGKFNADEWVAAAKSAGMRYIVLTCKHHDGFCLWDTQQTDHNIMNTPFRRDVVKELSEACKRGGIGFGAYYSTCDWHHPDFPLTSPGGKKAREHSDLDRYTSFLKAQVSELLKNYGPLATLWFDVPQKFDRNRGQDVINMARGIQPDILVDDRTGAPGDYSTPEQKVGGFNMKRPWESCMTVSAHNHWAWGGSGDGVKPLSSFVTMLAQCAGGDGNMLLNVGPRPDGLIDPAQAGALKGIGDWLKINGESIYGTRGGPYTPTAGYTATRKGNVVYLHILRWDGDTARLPPLGAVISRSSLLSGGEVAVENTSSGLTVKVAPADQKSPDTVVKLELTTEAMGLKPIRPASSGE
jgi:alpha-L-fucosidase